MMLAASAFSLLLPGLAAGTAILGSKGLGAGIVVVGMALGVLLMLGPHDRCATTRRTGRRKCGPQTLTAADASGYSSSLSLCTFAEGMTVKSSFAQNDLTDRTTASRSHRYRTIPEGYGAVALIHSATSI